MSSTYTNILNAVRTIVSGVSGISSCVIRKRPYYDRERGDSLPLAVISPRKEQIHSKLFAKSTQYRYPVLVTLIQQGDLVVLDPRPQLDLRADIRDALFNGSFLSAVSNVWNVDYLPDPPFDTSALDTALDASAQEFGYYSAEDRPS